MATFDSLHTQALDDFIAACPVFLRRYQSILTTYQSACQTLLQTWKGRGADAFAQDEKMMLTCLQQSEQVLSTLFTAVKDCRDLYLEADSGLGAQNRAAFHESYHQ